MPIDIVQIKKVFTQETTDENNFHIFVILWQILKLSDTDEKMQ